MPHFLNVLIYILQKITGKQWCECWIKEGENECIKRIFSHSYWMLQQLCVHQLQLTITRGHVEAGSEATVTHTLVESLCVQTSTMRVAELCFLHALIDIWDNTETNNRDICVWTSFSVFVESKYSSHLGFWDSAAFCEPKVLNFSILKSPFQGQTLSQMKTTGSNPLRNAHHPLLSFQF